MGRHWPVSAVKLVDDLAGESPAGANCPVGTVVISGDGKGDQTVESPEVNALDGWTQVWSAPTGGLAKQQVVAKANCSQASKTHTSPESECEDEGNAETVIPRSRLEFPVKYWVSATGKFPVVSEDDMLRKTINESSEPVVGRLGIVGTCTAKVSRISRRAAKSGCARNWGGWGRLSVNGPGQNNPDRSEDPWGRAITVARMAAPKRTTAPTQSGTLRLKARGAKEGSKPDGRRDNWASLLGRPPLISQP
jgi:hypothetical protein